MILRNDASFAKKMVGETYDVRWMIIFCNFWSALDDDLKKKYPIVGLEIDDYITNMDKAYVYISDMCFTLRYQSTVYRAMSRIAEEEGDYRLATAFMMCVKTCVPMECGDARERQTIRMYHKEIDSKIAYLMVQNQKKDLFTLKG